MVCGVPECSANLANQSVDAGINIDKNVASPKMINDLVTGDEIAPTAHQQDEQLHGAPLDRQWLISLPQFVGGDVEDELTELKHERLQASRLSAEHSNLVKSATGFLGC